MAVVTELTIDGSGATRGAKEYESAMDRAQAAMQRGLGSMSVELAKARDQALSVVPSFNQMVIGITAASAAAAGFLAWVVATNKSLAEMSLAARRSNLDIERFQQLRAVAGQAGVSNSDFASGVENIAEKLNDSIRKAGVNKETEMSKLLDANNVKWKEGNKLLLDTDKLLDVARDLIYRARNEQDKMKMAEILGLTKDWVPLLDQSAKAFGDSQKEVTALGLVINRETVERAAEFDKEWRKASEVFSVWMKARLVDLLPFIDDLIAKATDLKNVAAKVIDEPEVKKVPGRFNALSEMFGEALLGPDPIKESFAVVAVVAKLLTGNLEDSTKALLDQDVAVNQAKEAWEDFGRRWQETRDRMEKAGAIPLPIAKPGDLTSFKPSTVPEEEKDSKRDFWERAVDSIDKHIARVNADSIAIGTSIGQHEKLRAEFALLEAAKQAGKEVDDEQIATYAKLRGTMSATQALGKAGIKLEDDDKESFDRVTTAIKEQVNALELLKIQSDIKRDRATLLFSPTDVEIANKLKGLYGDDLAAALASSEAQAMRLNAALKDIKSLGTDFAQTFVHGIMQGKSAMDSLVAATEQLATKLADKAIVDVLSGNFVQGAVEGIAAIGLALFGGNERAKKAHDEARKAWDDMAGQVAELRNIFTGKPFGDLTNAIRQSRDDLDKAMTAAFRAGDMDSVNRLASEWDAFVERKRAEFRASFFVLIDAFRDGFGDNSPLVQARENMVALGEKLKGFVADTQQAFGGGDTALGSFGAGAGDASVQIAQAQEAARQMALAALSTVQPLTDTEKRLMEIKGAAQGLQQVLVDLGLSADAAAQAISAGTAAALDKLKASFSDNLTRDINAATGKGFLNDIGDLVKRFQQMQSDTVSLGADPSLLTRWLDVQAQKIINDAQLTGQAFDDLVVAFPFLQGNVTAFTGALTRSAQDIATAKQSFQDQLFTLGQDQSTLAGQLTVFDLQAQRAREDEVAKGGQALADLEALQAAQRLNVVKSFNDKMLEDTQRALEEAQNFIQGITRRIKEYLDGLKSGSESPLSPSARLSAAQTAYNTQLALSQTAGPNQRDALGGITQYADSLLGAAKSFYGSASGFQTIFNNIQTQLGALPSQISPEQFIVNAIISQTTALSTAIATGSAAAIATALFPMFDSIDTNMDDNISLPEMITALGSSFSAGTLQSIFSKLDGNGNGLLTKAELQGAIATNILTNTLTTASGTQSTAAGTGSVLLSNQAQESLLNALIGLNTTASTQLSLLTQQFTNTGSFALSGLSPDSAATTFSTIPMIQNAMLTALNKIVWNTFATAQNTAATIAQLMGQQGAGALRQWGTFAGGGLVNGVGSGTSDSNLIWASNREFVVNAASAARNLPLLHAINDNAAVGFGGDSGAVVKELRAVAAEIRRLAIMVGSGTELTAAVRDGVAQTAEITDKMVKLLLRKPKAAA